MALRDKIFEAQDIESELVEVPEWGVTIDVRGMTGGDRSRLMSKALDPDTGNINVEVIYPELVIASSYDPEDGGRVFTDGDTAAIQEKSAAAIDRVAKVALRLSGLAEGAQEEAKKSVPEESE